MDKKLPDPTGNIWSPDLKTPATVPIATQLVMSHVEGPFREQERKLWAFLIQAVWDDLDKDFHEISVSKVSAIFRELGSRHDSQWLKNYLYSIAQTTMVFEGDDERHSVWQTTNLLSSARITKDKDTGEEFLSFEVPRRMVLMLRERARFTRLRPHVMISLSGKYSVTLYELLESVVNHERTNSPAYLRASIEQLRAWLKVPNGKLKLWGDFHRRTIKPAVEELNRFPEETGFTVSYEIIKGARNKVCEVIFHVQKVTSRRIFEARLKSPREENKELEKSSFSNLPKLNTKTYENAQRIAQGSGLDIYALEADWRSEFDSKAALVKNPQGHFISYVKRKVETSRQQGQGFFASLFGKRPANE